MQIKKLDIAVVNRIAAGEVIHRPSSAIKELIENSIDAKCTLLSVSVKGGGLEWIQIQDNGKGIHKKDLSIVCERFTTSKLHLYDDLRCMSTYGFRGEALASISHVSVLTIMSKTHNSPCAYKAKYQNGLQVPLVFGGCIEPVPCAGSYGTIITVEDLFYNVQIRKQSLKSSNEEYQRILDIVIKYSIHYGDRNVGFVCKKVGSTSLDVNTDCKSSTLDNIRKSFGSLIHRELVPLSQNIESEVTLSLSGYMTNSNFACKKATFILFINDRLVDCKSIRQAIESAYSELLSGPVLPFVYLSLRLPAETVDVNVHPTKNEVHFLFEEEVAMHIHSVVFSTLNCAVNSKKFSVLSVASTKGTELTRHDNSKVSDINIVNVIPMNFSLQSEQQVKTSTSNRLVRSSVHQTLMDSFLTAGENILICVQCDQKMFSAPTLTVCCCFKNDSMTRKLDVKGGMVKCGTIKRGYRACATLVQSIEESKDIDLCQMLNNCIYVGSVDEVFSVVQSADNLWLVDHTMLMESLFYQILIMSGGELSVIRPVAQHNIFTLIDTAVEVFDCEKTVTIDEQHNMTLAIVGLLMKNRNILSEFFGLNISASGELLSVPLILDGIAFSQEFIPSLLLNLGVNVHWDDSSECFRDIALVFAKFFRACSHVHSFEINEFSVFPALCVLRDIIFPVAIHGGYLPPIPTRDDEVMFTLITSLNQLYKVFERC